MATHHPQKFSLSSTQTRGPNAYDIEPEFPALNLPLSDVPGDRCLSELIESQHLACLNSTDEPENMHESSRII